MATCYCEQQWDFTLGGPSCLTHIYTSRNPKRHDSVFSSLSIAAWISLPPEFPQNVSFSPKLRWNLFYVAGRRCNWSLHLGSSSSLAYWHFWKSFLLKNKDKFKKNLKRLSYLLKINNICSTIYLFGEKWDKKMKLTKKEN